MEIIWKEKGEFDIEFKITRDEIVKYLRKIMFSKYFLREKYLVQKLPYEDNHYDTNLISEFEIFFPEGVEGDKLLERYVFFISKKEMII